MLNSIRASLAGVLVLCAAAIAACGSHDTGFSGDDGGGGGDDGGAVFGGGTGSSSGGSSGVSSGFSQGGSSSSSSGGSTTTTQTTCDSTCAAAGGKCSGTTCTISENPANVSSANQTLLKAGGKGDASFAWVYPYDATVFARGLISPTMQFAGSAASSVMVQITGTGISYTGYLSGGSGSTVSAAMSQTVWDAVTHAVGGTTLTVQVSKISGATVTGPAKETWTIAQGSLRGTIYYETYLSTIVAGNAALAAATGIGIMKSSPAPPSPRCCSRAAATSVIRRAPTARRSSRRPGRRRPPTAAAGT